MNKVLVSCIFIICCLCACAANQRSLQESTDTAAASVMEKINGGADHIPDRMQALADVDISTFGRRYSMRLALVLKKPQNLRAESIPLIGTPDFFLTINESKMKAFLPHNGEFYIGAPTAKNFEKFFPLKLPVEGITALLMGVNPAIKKGAQLRLGAKEGDLYRIDEISGNGKIKSLWIDSINNRLLKILLYDEYENPLYTFYFQDFSKADKGGIPQKIYVILEENKSSITIHYTDIQYSIELNDLLFDLELPKGIEPIYLD